MSLDIKDRAKGAILGAFIGDAIALGPHWYYDLEEQYRDYGKWIDTYTNPKKVVIMKMKLLEINLKLDIY